jgi:CRP-like cAMP-binding protein
VTDCIVWHINREAFFDFMQQEPTVLRAFLEELSAKGRFLSGKMRSFAVKGLKNRVVEYLESHDSIISVADVAQQLGATRPSLSRLLSDMLDEGLVVKDGKGYRKA